MNNCKYCIEEIKEKALICKHCGKHQHISDSLQTHITILSFFYFIGGTLLLLGAIIVSTALTSINYFIPNEELPFNFLSILGTGIGGFLFLLSIIQFLCGYGLIKRKTWGRIYGLILCVLSLINIPIGTIIGIYGIWILVKPESIEIFIN